ncbi:MAG: hypothetical protein SCH66_00190 [Methanolobus sp.]|nr:hypothetical protein [Methanolobus sp.]
MKPQGKKILACLSMMLMVISIIPSGAVANETGTDSNGTGMLPFKDHFRGRGPGPVGPGNETEMQEFETEEEELEFLKERTVESIEKRIEILENFDVTTNENVTVESVEGEIGELEALIEEVNSASTLEELRKITADMKRPGHEMKKPEFETEEEELEFIRERTIESIEKRIEMLENFDGTADENMTAESVEEEVTKLEALIEEVNDASTLDEVKEITAEMMGPGNMMKGPGMEKPEFETEEEEIEFVKERTTESVDRMIGMLENIDLEDSGEITSDDIGSMISQLEDIKTSLDDEDLTLDGLEEMRERIFQIMETVRELMPAPENGGKRMPHHRGPMEEIGEN